jgi:hypothetical protein
VNRPSAGVRYVVDLCVGEDPEAHVYRGFAHLPDASLDLVVRVAREGGKATASIACPPGVAAKDKLEKEAAALVRAATKAAVAEGIEPPQRIARWRP